MYKSLFISLNLVGLMMVPLLYIGNITITQSGPSSVAPGDEIEVTINISKEGVQGPARLKLDLSEASGIELEEVESAGASFSFNETSGLFIWYSIQPDANVTLKYRIIADSDASGTKTITGQFSYLDVDERKKMDIEPFTFSVNGDAPVATSEPEEEVDVDEGGEETETAIAVNPEDETTPITTTESTPTQEDVSETIEEVVEEEVVEESTPVDEVEEEVVEVSTPDEEEQPTEEVEEEDIVEVSEEETSETEKAEAVPTGDEEVTCSRNIVKSGNSYIVSVTINKGINKGFARLKEEVPSGFRAEKLQTEGAVFKFADGAAKFLWSQIPMGKQSITVKYRLVPEGNVSGTYNIRGSFSAEFLVENDRPKKVVIEPTSFDVEEGLVADTPSSNNSSNTSSRGTGNSNEGFGDTSYETSSSNTGNGSRSSSNGTTSMGTTNTNGIKFRVQVIAAHNTVSKRFIKKRFGYSGPVNIENHEGWVKYTTNGYDTYKKARDNRNKLNKYDFDGPFVAAYNNGDRITVQEALMIANQSWIP